MTKVQSITQLNFLTSESINKFTHFSSEMFPDSVIDKELKQPACVEEKCCSN